MPVFRNLKTTRSSGRLCGQSPVFYDEHGWPVLESLTPGHRPTPGASRSSDETTSSQPPSPQPTARKTTSRRGGEGHVPRPKNAFILFRSWFYEQEKRLSGGQDQNDISVRAGKAWQALSPEEKRPFQLLAEQEKREHHAKFPDYTYAPNSRPSKPAPSRQRLSKAVNNKKRPIVIPNRSLSEELAFEESDEMRSVSSATDPTPRSTSHRSPTPQTPAFAPAITDPEPVLDLTRLSADEAEVELKFNTPFVPTSKIPSLGLPPSHVDSCTESMFDLSLRPPSYYYIDPPSGFKRNVHPQTLEEFLPNLVGPEPPLDRASAPNDNAIPGLTSQEIDTLMSHGLDLFQGWNFLEGLSEGKNEFEIDQSFVNGPPSSLLTAVLGPHHHLDTKPDRFFGFSSCR